ncbi:MAG: hypothetical protein K1X50_10440 [Candidatus Promineofilum sp.]|nr:hypothetical protein [Promineifilum sp.]
MTEKQLALLIRQIAGRIRALANESVLLTEPEERSIFDQTTVISALRGDTRTIAKPAAIWRMLDLADELEDEAELLKPISSPIEP